MYSCFRWLSSWWYLAPVQPVPGKSLVMSGIMIDMKPVASFLILHALEQPFFAFGHEVESIMKIVWIYWHLVANENIALQNVFRKQSMFLCLDWRNGRQTLSTRAPGSIQFPPSVLACKTLCLILSTFENFNAIMWDGRVLHEFMRTTNGDSVISEDYIHKEDWSMRRIHRFTTLSMFLSILSPLLYPYWHGEPKILTRIQLSVIRKEIMSKRIRRRRKYTTTGCENQRERERELSDNTAAKVQWPKDRKCTNMDCCVPWYPFL